MLSDSVFSIINWSVFIAILNIAYAAKVISKDTPNLVYGTESHTGGWIITALTILYIGLRPEYCYGDSALYAEIFHLVQNGIWEVLPGYKSELLWTEIELFFINHGSITLWYTFLALIYVGGIAYCCRKIFPYHFSLAIVVSFTAMSFFTYGTNGLRNGFSTSLVMLALPLLKSPDAVLSGEKTPLRQQIAGWTIIIMSLWIHRSTVALVAGLIAVRFLTNTRTNIIIWFAAVVLGFFFKDMFVSLFSNITGDFRLEFYNTEGNENLYGASRFRWDFILYSFAPILLGYRALCAPPDSAISDSDYEIEMREKKYYSWLLNLYIIVNAGWVLINNIAFSNRFAYLSWILYPIVLLYPLVKFNQTPSQPKLLAALLIIFMLFDLVML